MPVKFSPTEEKLPLRLGRGPSKSENPSPLETGWWLEPLQP